MGHLPLVDPSRWAVLDIPVLYFVDCSTQNTPQNKLARAQGALLICKPTTVLHT